MSASFSARYNPIGRLSPGGDVPIPKPDEMSLIHELRCRGRLSVLARVDFRLRSPLGNVDLELNQEIHRAHQKRCWSPWIRLCAISGPLESV
jgi:hypothetical protein